MKTSSIHLQTTNNLHSSKQFVLYSGSHLQQGQEGKLLNPIILRVRDQRKAEIRQFPYRRSSRTQFWHVSTTCKRLQSSEKCCEICQLGYKMQNLVSQERLWTKQRGKASKEEETPFAGQALLSNAVCSQHARNEKGCRVPVEDAGSSTGTYQSQSQGFGRVQGNVISKTWLQELDFIQINWVGLIYAGCALLLTQASFLGALLYICLGFLSMCLTLHTPNLPEFEKAMHIWSWASTTHLKPLSGWVRAVFHCVHSMFLSCTLLIWWQWEEKCYKNQTDFYILFCTNIYFIYLFVNDVSTWRSTNTHSSF